MNAHAKATAKKAMSVTIILKNVSGIHSWNQSWTSQRVTPTRNSEKQTTVDAFMT